jgi:hypothetical protein
MLYGVCFFWKLWAEHNLLFSVIIQEILGSVPLFHLLFQIIFLYKDHLFHCELSESCLFLFNGYLVYHNHSSKVGWQRHDPQRMAGFGLWATHRSSGALFKRVSNHQGAHAGKDRSFYLGEQRHRLPPAVQEGCLDLDRRLEVGFPSPERVPSTSSWGATAQTKDSSVLTHPELSCLSPGMISLCLMEDTCVSPGSSVTRSSCRPSASS